MESKGEVIIYRSPEGGSKLEVKLKDNTVWLTLDQVANLFSKAKSTISYHISSVYKEKELKERSTVRKFRTVQIEGDRKITRRHILYSLGQNSYIQTRISSYSK